MEVESISGIHVIEEYNDNETNNIIHVDGDNGSDSYVSQDETCTVEPITSKCNDEVPQEGMRFEYLEAAFDFYNKYSKRMGFSIRCSSTRRSKKYGSVIAREYVCSKQGLWHKKCEGNQSRPYTRIECQAKLRIKKDEYGIWFFTKHEKDHSHAFTSPSKVHLLRSHHTIPKAMREMIYMYNSCGLIAPNITKSRIAYDFFGDVIIFDTTYKTNAYRTPYAPILGVNHHTKTIFLGCALLYREDEESFTWLFTKWLEVMNGCQSKTIITDQYRAMALAIKNVLLESRHGLFECKHPSFRRDLIKCIDHCTTIMEFEDEWRRMIERYELINNDWIESLYQIRHQWIDVYLQDCFSAGNRTSGRSEAMNKDINAYVNSHTNLTTFVSRLQELIDKFFDEVNSTDFKAHNEAPVMKIATRMERQMAQLYIPIVFKNFFQSELMKATDLTCDVQEDDGMICTFSLKEYWACHLAHAIAFSNNEEKVTCSCYLYERMGIPYSHILMVFVLKYILELPHNYIMK
ncbi:hypothetical protein AMTRI_Chr05g63970 [Amborella trichopoda]